MKTSETSLKIEVKVQYKDSCALGCMNYNRKMKSKRDYYQVLRLLSIKDESSNCRLELGRKLSLIELNRSEFQV